MPGNRAIRLRSIRVRGPSLFTSQPTFIEIGFDCYEIPKSLCFGVDIHSPSGEVIMRLFQSDVPSERCLVPGIGPNVWRCGIPGGLLNIGEYLAAPRIARFGSYWTCKDDPCLQFTMTLDHGVSPYWNAVRSRGNRPRVIAPIVAWEDVTSTRAAAPAAR